MIDLERYKLADVVRICKAQGDGCGHCRFYDDKEVSCTFRDHEVYDWQHCFDSSECGKTPEVVPEDGVMKYTLSDVRKICLNHPACDKCPFSPNDNCLLGMYSPDLWLNGLKDIKPPEEDPPKEEPPKEDPPEVPPEETPNDAVSHPSHYCVGDIEVIDYIRDKLSPDEFIGYCTGNVLKYVSRWRHKGGVEDLEKGAVYLAWAIEAAKKHINNWHESAEDAN